MYGNTNLEALPLYRYLQQKLGPNRNKTAFCTAISSQSCYYCYRPMTFYITGMLPLHFELLFTIVASDFV